MLNMKLIFKLDTNNSQHNRELTTSVEYLLKHRLVHKVCQQQINSSIHTDTQPLTTCSPCVNVGVGGRQKKGVWSHWRAELKWASCGRA